ncbi:MAG: hypothetical protein ABJB10_21115, partial [Mesorhizobium sp.]
MRPVPAVKNFRRQPQTRKKTARNNDVSGARTLKTHSVRRSEFQTQKDRPLAGPLKLEPSEKLVS